jgi:hypothetical protein
VSDATAGGALLPLLTPETAAGLDAALGYAGGTHTLGDVLETILAGGAMLHEREGAAIVTEFLEYPRRRVLNFWLATGELDAVIALSRELLERAKNEWGCQEAVFLGRRGWEKALTSEGWAREPMVLMSRQL